MTALQKHRFSVSSLDPVAIRDRFFNGSGPTDLFGILASVDGRITGINTRIAQFAACMNTTAVAYELNATWISIPTFYAQCAEVMSPSGFVQWALMPDKTFYLYERIGDGIVAARVVQDEAVVNETIWLSVGTINRNGSHGVVQIVAKPVLKVLEMTVAGSGMGFCGAQLMSNKTVMNVTGSLDMGSTCAAADSSCCDAVDLSLLSASKCADVSSFALEPLGRQNYSTFGASTYPGGLLNRVVLKLNGTDACFFGPEAAIV